MYAYRRAAIPMRKRPSPHRNAPHRTAPHCTGLYRQAALVVDQLRMHHHQRGVRWSDMAVLYRKNDTGAWLQGALREHSVPFAVQGSALFREADVQVGFW